ncbi:ATP-binding protein [Streptomyces sp. NRRL F-2747]|uniref:ATP-binding protein n=1 Tax=Streptomyces sp. NRRL F-2747 TaxID=1463843 RepID=UPI00068D0F0C|nr:ATP-binding protein [Streptomyces sp. NRRL F-2747]
MLTTATLPARAIPSGAPAGAVVAGAPVGAPPVTTAGPSRVRGSAHWVAEPVPAAVPLLRTRVRSVLAGWPVRAEVADVLLLAVSELAGNAVRHAAAGGRMRIGLTFDGGWLRLEVADQGVRPPRLPDPAEEVDPDSESGRGLLIVQLLAVEAGGELHVLAGEFDVTVRVFLPAG